MTEQRSSSTRKPSYSPRPSSDRRGPSSDRKSWKPREENNDRPRAAGPRTDSRDAKPRSFSDRPSTGSRPFNREGRPSSDRPSSGSRPFNREGRPASDRPAGARPFNREDRPTTARSFNRDERSSVAPRSDRNERPSAPRSFDRGARPYQPRDDRSSAPRPAYRDRADRSSAPREDQTNWYAENRKSKFERSDDNRGDKTERKIPEGFDRLDEIKACGINACRAIFNTRKNDLVRAYVTEETVTEFGDMLKFCAANKKAYHVVTSEDLNKISGSTHHEGVCVIAKTKAQSWQTLQTKLATQKAEPALLLLLEDVGNPHNVGAIVRTAAHFGVSAVLAPGTETFKPSSSLLRTAEGGAEQVDIVATPDLSVLVGELRKLGFKILATASNGKDKLYADGAIPARTALIIGNESRGISSNARKLADSTLSIPGNGTVESLNVSAATATLCGEFWRRHKS